MNGDTSIHPPEQDKIYLVNQQPARDHLIVTVVTSPDNPRDESTSVSTTVVSPPGYTCTSNETQVAHYMWLGLKHRARLVENPKSHGFVNRSLKWLLEILDVYMLYFAKLITSISVSTGQDVQI
ncbi:hypothetical protein FRC14_006889 [Serendipita sp. 396]|nr:hypothetical protein FRC14_006889 [Serendipita sp. 396]